MRQAGRYLPEYRQLRETYSFVEMCTTPDLAVEVSLQPYRRFGFDGVVVFYDILFLAEAMGAPLRFTEEGPEFLRPLRTASDLDGLRDPDLENPRPERGLGALRETIRRVRSELPAETAVIGFAGAPFTLAAYLVEGSFRRSGDRIRRLLHQDPGFVKALLERLTTATADYLVGQVEAGADAVQLFDTWAGLLGVETYREFALPYERAVFDAMAAKDAPSVLYINGCSHLVEVLRESGASALSVDWRCDLADVRRRVGSDRALQGNLDPAALFQAPGKVKESVRGILEALRGDPGHVFNLGHGILPETPIASVEALCETVRGFV
jgi:uroporphyrinogen decarboxylase